jgi:hypothetical protein
MFWEPQMRAHLLALVDSGHDALRPVAIDAVGALQAPES